MQTLSARKKVLIICHDVIGNKMAGPGMRYKNVAEQVSTVADVTLALFSEDTKAQYSDKLLHIPKHGESYKKFFDENDVIFAQWLSREMLNYAHTRGKIVIFDMYAPVPIEYLASLEFSGENIGTSKDNEYFGVLETYKNYLSLGDYFVCSNPRQLDFWLGFATANRLIKPSSFSGNQSYMERFAICPMGTSKNKPVAKNLRLRKQLGFSKEDFVMIWTGGIYDWFDGQLVIEAMSKINDPRIKLVFLGTKHPNKIYTEEMNESQKTRALSEKLGLTNKSVFFFDGWLPLNERMDYFMDADAAIYADKDSLEARFSHRTRVLDHIWMDIPTICTKGDYIAEVIESGGFGLVSNRKPEDLAEIILKLSRDKNLVKQIKKNISLNKKSFTWDSTLMPLVSFIKNTPKKQPHQITKVRNKPRMRNRVRRAVKIIVKG